MTEKIRPRVRVAGILIEDDRILLIEHTKNNRKYWLVPGGGVDWGESAAEAHYEIGRASCRERV